MSETIGARARPAAWRSRIVCACVPVGCRGRRRCVAPPIRQSTCAPAATGAGSYKRRRTLCSWFVPRGTGAETARNGMEAATEKRFTRTPPGEQHNVEEATVEVRVQVPASAIVPQRFGNDLPDEMGREDYVPIRGWERCETALLLEALRPVLETIEDLEEYARDSLDFAARYLRRNNGVDPHGLNIHSADCRTELVHQDECRQPKQVVLHRAEPSIEPAKPHCVEAILCLHQSCCHSSSATPKCLSTEAVARVPQC